MVIIFFSLVSIEIGRIAINIHMYANRELVRLDAYNRRVISVVAQLGIALDIAAFIITGFLITVTFGSLASVLLVIGCVGYLRSIVFKQRVIVVINKLNELNLSYGK